MSKLVDIEQSSTTIEKIRDRQFIVFKTREIAAFLKKVHDLLGTGEVNTAQTMIIQFLQGLAEKIKK
ncbi:MAG: hypothetical protein EAX96_01225 [Candidatus Lokiarchaeota archaeon]|nr:hypothetical protein [Candidatus Lokiarchaeota archaeon]